MANQEFIKDKAQNIVSTAVVSFDSLGDSLLYILLANNLYQNGYDVTYFGNVGHQLSAWIPGFKTRPHPESDNIEDALAHYDIVFNSPPRVIRDRLAQDSEYLTQFRSRYLLICQKTPESWVCDHTERLINSLSPNLHPNVLAFAKASGSIRFRDFKDESTVDILCAYMREKMGLPIISRNVDLTPPPHLRFRRYVNRVIVSPDSAGPEDKNWGHWQFLSLCRKLKLAGYQPVIIVSPSNYSKWQLLNRGEFEMPMFTNIGDLAAFIYESALMVANDSGNGHLASFLGLPVVTIYKKRNPKFHWRPDWSPGKVVCPKVVFKFMRFRLWKPFVSTKQVMAAIYEMLNKY